MTALALSRSSAQPRSAAAPSPVLSQASEISMRTTSLWSGKPLSKLGRRSLVRLDRTCAYLRELYPHDTAKQVAADTGGMVGFETIRKWLAGKATPSGAAVVVLSAVYGPAFLLAVMDGPTDWMTEAGRAQARAQLDEGIAALEALRKEIA